MFIELCADGLEVDVICAIYVGGYYKYAKIKLYYLWMRNRAICRGQITLSAQAK